MCKTLRKDEGGVGQVIDYAMVLPVVMAVVLLLLVIGYGVLQKATIESATQREALFSAREISNPSYAEVVRFGEEGDGGGVTGAVYGDEGGPAPIGIAYDFISQNNDPYRYLGHALGVLTGSSASIEGAGERLSKTVNRNTLESGRQFLTKYKGNVSRGGYLFPYVVVEASQQFQVPDTIPVISLPALMTMESKSQAPAVEPAEMIRNVDMVGHYVNKSGLKDVLDSLVSCVGSFLGR
jgi:hypothetical protein